MATEDHAAPEEEPEIIAPLFPPIPVTSDPQAPAGTDDPLAPAVPSYPAPEPVEDPAPDWLTP